MLELNIFWNEVADQMAALGVHGPDDSLDPTTIMVLSGLMGYEEEMAVTVGPQLFAENFLHKIMR